MIVPNGYNIGRDKFVSEAVGEKKFWFTKYTTTVEDITDLLPAGAMGVNHGTLRLQYGSGSADCNQGIAQDGVVKLLTVTARFSLF